MRLLARAYPTGEVHVVLAARRVMATPGLVVAGVLVSAGRVPTRDQVQDWPGAG